MSECDVEYVIMPNWCVAAVGADGHRVVLDRFVSRERAEELRQMLVSCQVFREVAIERELRVELISNSPGWREGDQPLRNRRRTEVSLPALH